MVVWYPNPCTNFDHIGRLLETFLSLHSCSMSFWVQILLFYSISLHQNSSLYSTIEYFSKKQELYMYMAVSVEHWLDLIFSPNFFAFALKYFSYSLLLPSITIKHLIISWHLLFWVKRVHKWSHVCLSMWIL